MTHQVEIINKAIDLHKLTPANKLSMVAMKETLVQLLPPMLISTPDELILCIPNVTKDESGVGELYMD